MRDKDRTIDSIHLLALELMVKTTNTFKTVIQVLPVLSHVDNNCKTDTE